MWLALDRQNSKGCKCCLISLVSSIAVAYTFKAQTFQAQALEAVIRRMEEEISTAVGGRV